MLIRFLTAVLVLLPLAAALNFVAYAVSLFLLFLTLGWCLPPEVIGVLAFFEFASVTLASLVQIGLFVVTDPPSTAGN